MRTKQLNLTQQAPRVILYEDKHLSNVDKIAASSDVWTIPSNISLPIPSHLSSKSRGAPMRGASAASQQWIWGTPSMKKGASNCAATNRKVIPKDCVP
jgi:hypothetical protein